MTTLAQLRASLRPFRWRLARDLAALVAAVALFSLDHHLRMQVQSGVASWLVGAVAGGAAVWLAFIAHEWGHWLGAVLSGAEVTPRSLRAALLFDFDEDRNSRRQFLWMSVGGYLASIAAVGFIVSVSPWEALSGRVALVLTALGMAVTFTVEMPQTLAALRRGEATETTPHRAP